MQFFVEQLIDGIAVGGIYASLALALVMIFKSTGHVNFAQGEMAMVSVYIAASALDHGVPFWLAFPSAIVASAVLGAALERLVVRPFARQSDLVVVTVLVGLFVALNALAGWLWGYTVRSFPSPFPDRTLTLFADVTVRFHTLGSFAATLAVLGVLFAFFRFTTLGLAMRGAAENPASARLLGIGVNRLLGLGWAFAASVGAVAGLMVAPSTFLDPHMMAGPLIFSFAGALLGGLSSPAGAVLGGFLVGVLEVGVASYVPHGGEFRTTFALTVIVAVLLLRPQGLLGLKTFSRV